MVASSEVENKTNLLEELKQNLTGQRKPEVRL